MSDGELILTWFTGMTLLFAFVLLAVILIPTIIATWKIYVKAGKPGWYSIIPFYRSWVMYDFIFGNGLYMLLTFVPVINVLVIWVTYYKMARVFGQSELMGIINMFFYPVGIWILGFGKAQYEGPTELFS